MTLTPVLGLARDEAHLYSAWYPPAPPLVLPSVTTALDVLAKHALLNWYPKVAAYYALDNAEALLRQAAEAGREPTAKLIASQGRLERDRRGDIGTRTHQAVEALLAGMAPLTDDDTKPLFDQYRRFALEWRFKPIWSEALVASERYGYAGTFDLYGRLAGRRALIDIKTGSFIAPEMGLQLAAYGAADYIGKPGVTDRWAIPPVDLYAVLQLQPDKYRLIPFHVTPAAVASFVAALDVYRWQQSEGRKIIGQDLTAGVLQIA